MKNLIKLGICFVPLVAGQAALGIGIGLAAEKAITAITNKFEDKAERAREIEKLEEEFGVKIVSWQ